MTTIIASPSRSAQRHLARALPGFSLLELTLVLAIMGVLMAVAAVNIIGSGKRANIRATKTSMYTISGMLKDYYLTHSSAYPPDLATLVPDYLEQQSLTDAWNELFWYAPSKDLSGNEYQFSSAGPDKEHGTEDDINWWNVQSE